MIKIFEINFCFFSSLSRPVDIVLHAEVINVTKYVNVDLQHLLTDEGDFLAIELEKKWVISQNDVPFLTHLINTIMQIKNAWPTDQ